MRQDKTASLRERLRLGAQKFDFDALIQGVSTVDDAEEPKPVSTPSAPSQEPAVGQSDRERLRAALDQLGTRLLQETGRLGAALATGDTEASGLYLAKTNEALDLLHSVDPGGDMARRLRTTAAPPPGRSWPATAWTVAELAASPLSGLLPPGADDSVVRGVLAVACDV